MTYTCSLSLAADLVLLDKQLHKAALMLGGILGHLPEIGEDTGGQQIGADKVRRTVAGALLVAAFSWKHIQSLRSKESSMLCLGDSLTDLVSHTSLAT